MGEVCDRAAWNVVQHHWQVNRFGNRFEVQVLAFLGGLVVVRNDLQLAVCTYRFRELRSFNRFFGGVGATTGHDRNPACGLGDRDADDFTMFFNANGG